VQLEPLLKQCRVQGTTLRGLVSPRVLKQSMLVVPVANAQSEALEVFLLPEITDSAQDLAKGFLEFSPMYGGAYASSSRTRYFSMSPWTHRRPGGIHLGLVKRRARMQTHLRHDAVSGVGVRPLALHATWPHTLNVSSMLSINLKVARFLRDHVYAPIIRCGGIHNLCGSYEHDDDPDPEWGNLAPR